VENPGDPSRICSGFEAIGRLEEVPKTKLFLGIEVVVMAVAHRG
jgi:hypothetical protein